VNLFDSLGSGKRSVVSSCAYSNEILGFSNCGKFLDFLRKP